MEEFTKSLDETIEIFERNIIEKTLKDTNGNQSKAALILGISKRKIQYKIDKYGINFRAIKEEYAANKHILLAWHHFFNANRNDEQCHGLLLP
jgi:Bacterial regulatory protein, Fis family